MYVDIYTVLNGLVISNEINKLWMIFVTGIFLCKQLVFTFEKFILGSFYFVAKDLLDVNL